MIRGPEGRCLAPLRWVGRPPGFLNQDGLGQRSEGRPSLRCILLETSSSSARRDSARRITSCRLLGRPKTCIPPSRSSSSPDCWPGISHEKKANVCKALSINGTQTFQLWLACFFWWAEDRVCWRSLPLCGAVTSWDATSSQAETSDLQILPRPEIKPAYNSAGQS